MLLQGAAGELAQRPPSSEDPSNLSRLEYMSSGIIHYPTQLGQYATDVVRFQAMAYRYRIRPDRQGVRVEILSPGGDLLLAVFGSHRNVRARLFVHVDELRLRRGQYPWQPLRLLPDEEPSNSHM